MLPPMNSPRRQATGVVVVVALGFGVDELRTAVVLVVGATDAVVGNCTQIRSLFPEPSQSADVKFNSNPG
jgi:hypothetical protein